MEYPASVPFDPFHLTTNTVVLPPVLGKLTPVDVGFVPNVFIGTVTVEVYDPATYMF
jgi:hypothetical protein